MTHGVRRVSAVAVLLLGLALPAPPVAAQAGTDLAPVMVVLDASGSMKEAMAGGTKLTVAKRAVRTLVSQAPDDAWIGLTVYGTGTGSASADKPVGCRDVRIVHPVGPLDRSALNGAVDVVEPRGYTPIGRSLRAAADALPAKGSRSIVLVSDGVDTCAPPDPCEVAEELAEQGVDLRIHAIGFDVDSRARRQLACLAGATGGSYVDAPDAASLTGALNRITQQALRSYEPLGTPVTGSTTPAAAPNLAPGAYLDRIGAGEHRYYTVDVPAGDTLHASATAVNHSERQAFVKVARFDAEQECFPPADSGPVEADKPVMTAALRWTAGSGTVRCERPGRMVLDVWLDPVFTSGDPFDAALELLIGLEPPLAGNSGPPGTEEPVAFTAPENAAKVAVGGGSFNAAATLDGPGSYTDTVLPTEMVFYRVRLDWGQGLAYRIRMGPAEDGSVLVSTYWYSPDRDLVDSESTIFDGTRKTLAGRDGAVATPPVRFRNRELNGPQAGVSLAGWYYIAVLVDDNREAPVPVTIDVSVDGATGGAVPAYAGGAGENTFGDPSGRTPRPDGGASADRDLRKTVAGSAALRVGVPAGVVVVALVVVGVVRVGRVRGRRTAR